MNKINRRPKACLVLPDHGINAFPFSRKSRFLVIYVSPVFKLLAVGIPEKEEKGYVRKRTCQKERRFHVENLWTKTVNSQRPGQNDPKLGKEHRK
ncbi:MAG: hypothetical protein LBQ44_06660 [Treponema sp.]|nr:hypothetical protein [Treponema sp.]